MQETMFQDKNPEERLILLRDTCDKSEIFNFEKAFTEQDVDIFRERLGEIMIDISKVETELAKVKKEYTDKMKPLKKEIGELLENIRFRSRMVEEQAYIFIDHEDNLVGYYSSSGELIHKRLLKIEEHQRTLQGASRKNNKEYAKYENVSD